MFLFTTYLFNVYVGCMKNFGFRIVRKNKPHFVDSELKVSQIAPKNDRKAPQGSPKQQQKRVTKKCHPFWSNLEDLWGAFWSRLGATQLENLCTDTHTTEKQI